MSIASEIQRIQNNIDNAYTAVTTKGGILPVIQNSSNLASSVNTISGGSSVIYAGCIPNYDTMTRTTNKITYNNGVVSNFYISSDSTIARWLYGDKYFPNYASSPFTTFELVITVKEIAFKSSGYSVFASSENNEVFGLGITSNGNIICDIGSGSGWYKPDLFNLTTSKALEPNTFYNIKLTYDGVKYTISVATDFANYEEWISVDYNKYLGASLSASTNVKFQLGASRLQSTTYFNSNGTEIDLSKCYIKIDGNMYWQGLSTLNSTDELASIKGFALPS